jgi:hypothetical protein
MLTVREHLCCFATTVDNLLMVPEDQIHYLYNINSMPHCVVVLQWLLSFLIDLEHQHSSIAAVV